VIERIEISHNHVECDICDTECGEYTHIYKVFANGDNERLKICTDCINNLHTLWVVYK
jgi:hypothetical protein